ncbi:hypothetical protein K501DRAFT_176834, partial [Backusella circina FSU 941]
KSKMDAEILKLSKAPTKARLVEFLNETTKEEITKTILFKLDDYNATNDVDSILFLRAFLLASNDKSKQATNIITMLLPEIELFPSNLLYNSGTLIISTMKNQNLVQTQVFDLLSKIWNLIIMEKDTTLSTDILQELINTDWNNHLAAALISSIKDMEFTNSQLEAIVRHLITKLDGLEAEEVPPFVSQLLTGTVMLHIAYGIKQDDDMGGEFIKLMKKNTENSLKIFNMACLLTIYDIIKAPILAAYKDAEKLSKCPWISDWSDENVDAYKKVLLDISEKSASGWDQVIQSLTRLSILLIDTAASQIPTFFLRNGIVVHTRSSTNETPMDQLAQLGIEVALRMFKHHEVIRSTLFEKITWSLISKNQSTVYFLDLLKRMIDECPQGVKSHMNRVCFENSNSTCDNELICFMHVDQGYAGSFI